MKLTDYQNEDALEVLANIIEPVTEILQDKKIARVFSGKKFNTLEVVKVLLKDHKKSVVEIMAALNNVPYEEYKFNIITGTQQLVELLNDKELIDFFQSQEKMMEPASSGSVMANTEGSEK